MRHNNKKIFFIGPYPQDETAALTGPERVNFNIVKHAANCRDLDIIFIIPRLRIYSEIPCILIPISFAVLLFAGISEFNRESSGESFQKFKKEYESRFREKVNKESQMAYETAYVLFSALSETDDPKKLKAAILKQRIFKGVDGEIIIDQYGDPHRSLYIQASVEGTCAVPYRSRPVRPATRRRT